MSLLQQNKTVGLLNVYLYGSVVWALWIGGLIYRKSLTQAWASHLASLYNSYKVFLSSYRNDGTDGGIEIKKIVNCNTRKAL